jgi:predicted nucleic acid-binding protein
MTGGSPVARGLIDTQLLLDFRAGLNDALRFLIAVLAVGMPDISQLSAMALIAACPDAAELTSLQMFLSGCRIHSLTAKVARRAQSVLEGLPPPAGLSADDVIVAATAIEQSLPLYTLDPARFTVVPRLTAVRPY